MTTISSPQAHVSPTHLAANGFQTPPFGADGAYLAVNGTDLIVGDEAGARRTPLTTIRAAASFAGITAGAPAQMYRPATPLDLDQPLLIDPGAARLLDPLHRADRHRRPGSRFFRTARARLQAAPASHPGRMS